MKFKKILLIIILGIFLNFNAKSNSDRKQFHLNEEIRTKIVKTVIKKLNAYYVYPNIAKKYQLYLKSRLDQKAYSKISDLSAFVQQLSKDLLSIYPDGHLDISVYHDKADPGKNKRSQTEWWKRYVKNAKFKNCGFYRVERLPGNIGYLDLRFFDYPKICYKTAIASMAFLSTADAIIIDLRKNPGGRSELSQILISYFFEDHRVHYMTEIDRQKKGERQWWTLPEVPGRRMPDTPLYILIGKGTGSAAEEFAYALKHLKRATLIGETTAGAAHKTHMHFLPELHISIAIPDGTSIHPLTGKDWEGTGVTPHILVNTARTKIVAHKMALTQLIKNQTDRDIIFKLEWVKKELNIKEKPIVLKNDELEQYIGNYG
jgi:hypothetical protein